MRHFVLSPFLLIAMIGCGGQSNASPSSHADRVNTVIQRGLDSVGLTRTSFEAFIERGEGQFLEDLESAQRAEPVSSYSMGTVVRLYQHTTAELSLRGATADLVRLCESGRRYVFISDDYLWIFGRAHDQACILSQGVPVTQPESVEPVVKPGPAR